MANRRRDVKFHNCKYSQIQRHLPMTCPSKAFHISRSLFVLSNSSALEFSAQNLAGLFCLPKKVQKQFFKTFLELRSMCSQGKKNESGQIAQKKFATSQSSEPSILSCQRQITLRIVGYHFSSRLTATLKSLIDLSQFSWTCSHFL